MEIVTERVDGLGGVTVIQNRDEKFFCLDDILRSLGKETKPCGSEHS